MADDWLANEIIEVDIQKLDDFATYVMDELRLNFQPSLESGINHMLTIPVPFGGSGLSEGRFFQGRHDENRQAAAQLLGEVTKGLASLSVAAKSISAEYSNGDALAEADNKTIYGAFMAVDGQETLSGLWQDPGNDVEDPSLAVEPEGSSPYAPGSADTGLSLYQAETVGEGAGAYDIDGDHEDMHDDRLDSPTAER
ncbi:hypothetical protein [Micromonospora sp. NBC_01813]|uniref:hypothetical protein n=1 Tax=Micromonospora sp. NBC_01813 TaxID=2975988 RepID=UPI002DD9DD24|nr:hypothetical protein [Micromonospora sp. NBC_01813]WSA07245.1 hypothetical protein OG958_23715 [Micromonospora sp. NBC_01813]